MPFCVSHAAIQTVKVPNVAESITEGTLKQWTKRVGDLVAVDEEVATIETDKVDVSVNATHAGKIVELLADEEATVTVGDDLFRIEEGAEGECKLQLHLSRAVLDIGASLSLFVPEAKRGTQGGAERKKERGGQRTGGLCEHVSEGRAGGHTILV